MADAPARCQALPDVGNLAIEVADHSTAIRGELAEGLDAWSAIVTQLVTEAQRQGEISPAGDPAQLGRFIVMPGRER
jgi:TetR/AcrR family transcriptional repressor of nem operon